MMQNSLEILLKSLKHHTKMLANTLLIMKFMKRTQTETLLPIFQNITLIQNGEQKNL
jgi:hypothetical protein